MKEVGHYNSACGELFYSEQSAVTSVPRAVEILVENN